MVKRYFDAFLYLANWGTRQVMFRLPRGVLDPETARQYCGTDTASLIETDSHLILNLCVDQVAAASSPPMEEPRGLEEWVASLAAEQKDALLARVAGGEGAAVQALLLRRFRAVGGTASATPGRTAAELWEAAADRKEARAKAAERRRRKEEARKAAEQAAARKKRLDQLSTRT